LAVLSLLYAAALTALIVLGEGEQPVIVVALCGFLVGATLPVTTSVLRARWPILLADREDLLGPAYALDSVMIELSFVLGPVITAGAVAASGARLALIVSGLVGALGPIAFVVALLRLPGHGAPPRRSGRSSLFGALSSPAIRALSLASLPLGFYLGSLDVGLPAYSAAIGEPALAGVLLALAALASTTAVLVYGLRTPRTPLWDLHLRFSLLLGVAILPLAISSLPGVVLVAVVLAGLPVAPVIASRNQLVREVAPAGAEAEAFTWPLTAMICGISIGAGVGGQLVEAIGWRAPVIAAAAVAFAGVASLYAFGRPEALGLRGG
jgi:MFS family permease